MKINLIKYENSYILHIMRQMFFGLETPS